MGEHLPNAMKRYLAENEINFYIINGTKIGQQLGLGNRTNTIMQSAFFKITNVIPYDLAVSEMKKAIDKSYGKKGEAIVKMNYAAVDAGGLAENVVKVTVPAEWANLKDEVCVCDENRPEFIRNVVDVMNAQKGMIFLLVHLQDVKTELSLLELLSSKNVVSLLTYRNGK